MSTRNLFAALVGLLMVAAATTFARHDADGALPIAQVVGPFASAEPSSAELPPNVDSGQDAVLTISLSVDQSMLESNDQTGLALVEVRAAEDAVTGRTPVAIALVIDTSGSMAGDKIEHARSAAAGLVRRLSDGDVVSVISYDRGARVVVAAEEIGRDRSRVLAAIEGLRASGNTCMQCGMDEGYAQLREAPNHYARRVVVLSDGQANQGISDANGLGGVSRSAGERGVVTSTIGLGADYDEEVMTAVAVGGSGAYYFLPDAQAMASIFERELRSLETTVATNVVIRLQAPSGAQIHTGDNSAVVADGNGVQVRIGQMAAGEVRRFLVPMSLHGAPGREWVSAAAAYETPRHVVGSVEASVALSRTDDASLAKASTNPAVVAEWEMIDAFAEAEEAMRQMRRGDIATATAELDAVVERLERQSASLDDAELADEARNMRALRDRVAAPGFAGDGAEGRGLYLQNVARSAESAAGVPRDQMYHEATVY